MRKALCSVLVLLIIFGTTFCYADDIADNTTTDLQTRRSELQNQLSEEQSNLNNVQSGLSENLQQVEKLDSRIEASEQKIEEQEVKITELKSSISQTESELDEVNQKYDKQKELFKNRLVAMYETGETRYLEILLKSKTLSDFLSSYFLITEISKLDNDVLTQLEEKKENIDKQKQKLENEKTELATIVNNQTVEKTTLENAKTMREVFISKLSDQEQELQAKIDEINNQYAEVNRQILALAQEYSSISAEYVGGVLEWPVPGHTLITSKFAMRVHPITKQYKLHTGVDIAAPVGTDFIAANDGIVVKAELTPAYGNMVVIDHGGGISTLYAHGSQIMVEVGQKVKRGDVVIKVGMTGYTTGPHAHFEVRKNGVPVNPLPYITTGLIPGEENNTNTVNENDSNTNTIATD